MTNHTNEQSSAQRLFEQAAEYERVGDWRQADSSYAALFDTGARAGDGGWVATAARRRAQVAFQRGEMDHAEELADLSKEIAVRCGMNEASARALNMLGMIQFNRNNHVRASETYAEAIAAARACGDDRTLIHASRNLGVVRENIGDLLGAKLHYLEGVAASLRENDARATASIYAHLGNVAFAAREYMESELHYRRAIELAQRAGDVYVETTAAVSLAAPLVAMGDLDTAEALLAEATTEASKRQNTRGLADIERNRAHVEMSRGNLKGADDHCVDALDIATTHNLSREKAEVLEDIGHLRQLQNRPILAKSAWREALEIFRDLGAEGSVARLTQLIEA